MLASLGITLSVLSLIVPNLWVAAATRGQSTDRLEATGFHAVAIVPGASVSRGRPSSSLRARLEAALGMYEQGRVDEILVSGLDTATSPEVTVMRSWLEAHGVPPRAIWSDDGGLRTRDTMLRAAALFDVREAVVCTQTAYMARTVYLARAAGIEAVGLSLAPRGTPPLRQLIIETLKTALAVVETAVRPGRDSLSSPGMTTEAP